MNYKNILALAPALALAACGGGDEQNITAPQTPGSVIYSYPADGQSEVSPKADLVLRFSHALTDEAIAEKIRVTDGTDDIAFTAEPVDDGRSLKLTPNGQLRAGASYSVEFTEALQAEDGRLIPNPNADGPEGIQFSTRGAFSGIAALDNLSGEFSVTEMIPSEGGTFRPMDFSTFRLRLSQPVHPEWQEKGGVIKLEDSAGKEVPAVVLVKGRYVTIDPCTAEDMAECGSKVDTLTPGETYTVSLSKLPSLTKESAVLDYTAKVTPGDTSPTVVLFQEVIDSGLNAGTEPRRSVLNGQIINGVTLNSVLQGIAGPSQQTGGLFAELAYAPAFRADEPLPLRVPRGSVLRSSSLDVKVNGTVPVIDPVTNAMQQTGEIKVTMLSDATGYMMPNPYTNDDSAPRHIKLFMDVAMNTEEAQPNASLSQDLLGVELTGIAMVEQGTLTIDAIGMVEPKLLGQEYTDSTIAFRIEAATDVDSQLDASSLRERDTTPPSLVSWMPGPDNALPPTRQAMQRPGDPVILNFDEPLDQDAVKGNVMLSTSSGDIGNLKTRVDGTVLVINPSGGLQHGMEYTVSVNGVTDLAGNPATVPALTFRLPDTTADNGLSASPIAVTTYPGYPCVTRDLDTGNDSHGFCADKPSEEGVTRPDSQPPEYLPVTTLPEDRPIVVVFSQSMNLDSINGDTFIVERVTSETDALGSGGPVPGRIEKNRQRIRFYPEEPWVKGQLYRYTMVSTQDGVCSESDPSFICGDNNLALQTDALVDPTDIGGSNLSIYFRGEEKLDSVFTPLRNLPVRDVNANFMIEPEEPAVFPSDDEIGAPAVVMDDGLNPSSNAARLRPAAAPFIITNEGESRVGCEVSGPDCPEDKFIYQTGGLNTEVIGPVDPEDLSQGVRVLLYPTMLVATSIDIYLDGDAFADLVLDPAEPQVTGPQLLRMRYADLDGDGVRGDPIPGVISSNGEGKPIFTTSADLLLDAPALTLPLGNVLAHNLFGYQLTLELGGDITFFDDGRMQIEQRNSNTPPITVAVEIEDTALEGAVDFINCLGGLLTFNFEKCESLAGGSSEGAVVIPLEIPQNGVYLNFLSNPVKEIPEAH
ncbi:Ig-like domain-containing protein [Marinobacter salicampi]|uniref:Ig-like domain-containing protein n=1 Tax=Marinobacter salicampi TaxID=435907 RepID=UPI00140C81C6|nr:Ig-like domain-containing protein [Marinobacter salicampi]